MLVRLPLAARAGLFLILIGAGWFGARVWWTATRIWVPLEMPISLSRGHHRSAEFDINLEGTYLVVVGYKQENGYSRSFAHLNCPSGLPQTEWSITKRSKVITSHNEQPDGAIGGWFYAEPGRYILDLHVLDDGSCLNAGLPLLDIYAPASRQEEAERDLARTFFPSLFVVLTGFVMIALSYNAIRNQLQLCSLTEPGPHPPLPGYSAPRRVATPPRVRGYNLKKPLQRYVWAFQKTSWYPLFASFFYIILVILAGFISPAFTHGARGLVVHFVRPGIAAVVVPGLDPLLIEVDTDRHSLVRTLYIGSQRVPPEDFDKALRKGLALRPPDLARLCRGRPGLSLQRSRLSRSTSAA